MRRAALHNLGCKVNAYETEAMTQTLKKAGYTIVPFEEPADVYIVNTCSVTNMADRKSRQMLHKAKKNNPNAVVVAVGCYVQTAAEEVKNDSAVDIIVGNNRKGDIVRILEEYYAGNAAKDDTCPYVINIDETKEYENLSITTVTGHTRAHIKIQDGCNNFCSYCIIPYARGRIRSRSMEQIREEMILLASNGFQEIVLTGINLSCYEDHGKKLIDVLEMAEEIEGIERIRLSSLEPEIITEDFVKRLCNMKKICPHFHLSLQSGCDKTLKKMNRHYTSGEYYKKCEMLRRAFQSPAITTDIIVGFPGETEEDYEETEDFVRKIEFAQLHVFRYSKRDGTVAARMEQQVAESEKAKRSERLIKLGAKLTRNYRESRIGQRTSVLFEEKKVIKGISYWIGHTKDYIEVALKNPENLSGIIMEVTLKDFVSHEIMLATR